MGPKFAAGIVHCHDACSDTRQYPAAHRRDRRGRTSAVGDRAGRTELGARRAACCPAVPSSARRARLACSSARAAARQAIRAPSLRVSSRTTEPLTGRPSATLTTPRDFLRLRGPANSPLTIAVQQTFANRAITGHAAFRMSGVRPIVSDCNGEPRQCGVQRKSSLLPSALRRLIPSAL